MATSTFILNTARKPLIKAQTRILEDRLGDQGSSLKGVFADRNGQIEELAGLARYAMELWSLSPLKASLSVLRPANDASKGRSMMKVPFKILNDRSPHTLDSAAAIASKEPTEDNGGQVIELNVMEHTMLAIAVLRRMGIRSSFCFMGTGACPPGESYPVIFVHQEDPLIMCPASSAISHLPITGSEDAAAKTLENLTMEVLDDDALSAYIQITRAYRAVCTFMEEVKADSLPALARPMVSVSLGHELYAAAQSWDIRDALKAKEQLKEMIGPSCPPASSIRELLERGYVGRVRDPGSHLAEFAKGLGIELPSSADKEGVKELIQTVVRHPNEILGLLDEYGQLMRSMISHFHPLSECKKNKKIGSA